MDNKKLKELADKVIAEWRKKYPKAKLIKKKQAAIVEALDSETGWDFVLETFHEEFAGAGSRMATKMLKGKIPAKDVEEVSDLVWHLLADELAALAVPISG